MGEVIYISSEAACDWSTSMIISCDPYDLPDSIDLKTWIKDNLDWFDRVSEMACSIG